MSPLEHNAPVHFIMPAQPLLRYVSTYYFFRIDTGEDEEQEDLLHPEWSSAHFTLSGSSRGNIVTEPPFPTPQANVTGPTGKASRIFCKSMSLAGIGILPLGWHRLVKAPADRWANRVGDLDHPEFVHFRKIWEALQGFVDPEEIAALFDGMLLRLIDRAGPARNGYRKYSRGACRSEYQQRRRSRREERHQPATTGTAMPPHIRLSAQKAIAATTFPSDFGQRDARP